MFIKPKNSIQLAIVLSVVLCHPVFALGNDKVLHFGVSSLAGYLAETVIHDKFKSGNQRVLYGVLLGSVPGLIKEIRDSGEANNYFSTGDMLADIAGAFAGSYIANTVNRRYVATITKDRDNFYIGFVYRD